MGLVNIKLNSTDPLHMYFVAFSAMPDKQCFNVEGFESGNVDVLFWSSCGFGIAVAKRLPPVVEIFGPGECNIGTTT